MKAQLLSLLLLSMPLVMNVLTSETASEPSQVGGAERKDAGPAETSRDRRPANPAPEVKKPERKETDSKTAAEKKPDAKKAGEKTRGAPAGRDLMLM